MSDQELRAMFNQLLREAMGGKAMQISHTGMTGMTLKALADVAVSPSVVAIAKAKEVFEWQLDGTQADMQEDMRRAALINAQNRVSRA